MDLLCRWLVLVDAAALAANTPIDLTKYPADFVVTSFYKIFGYPTGIGALLVRNGSHSLSSWAEYSLVDHGGLTQELHASAIQRAPHC
jgi:selenocysteine lyase/cysteine desulfurase